MCNISYTSVDSSLNVNASCRPGILAGVKKVNYIVIAIFSILNL